MQAAPRQAARRPGLALLSVVSSVATCELIHLSISVGGTVTKRNHIESIVESAIKKDGQQIA
jgi:hypothetical protein